MHTLILSDSSNSDNHSAVIFAHNTATSSQWLVVLRGVSMRPLWDNEALTNQDEMNVF